MTWNRIWSPQQVVSLTDLSGDASARVEFEPLCDVFCFVSCFGILILYFAIGSHVGARLLLNIGAFLSK